MSGSDIHYSCGCVEYMEVTDPYGNRKKDIVCDRDMATETTEIHGVKDSEKKSVDVVRWDCPRRNQRDEPIEADILVKKKSGQTVRMGKKGRSGEPFPVPEPPVTPPGGDND